MKAGRFPGQHSSPLSARELLALRALSDASPAPLLAVQVLKQHGTEVHMGLEELRCRGWVRLRGYPRPGHTTWSMTPRGLQEAAVHPDLNGCSAAEPQPAETLDTARPVSGTHAYTLLALRWLVEVLLLEPGEDTAQAEEAYERALHHAVTVLALADGVPPEVSTVRAYMRLLGGRHA